MATLHSAQVLNFTVRKGDQLHAASAMLALIFANAINFTR